MSKKQRKKGEKKQQQNQKKQSSNNEFRQYARCPSDYIEVLGTIGPCINIKIG